MKKASIRTLVITFVLAIVVITSLILGSMSIISIKQSANQSVNKYNDAMNNGYKTEIKSEIETAITVLQTAYDQYKAGKISEAKAKETAKETIRNMRYREDESGYFWIDDTDYNLVMHPILTEQEGDNRKNITDQNGVKILQEIMSSVTDSKSDGYNEFYYTKSDGKTVAPKISYSELFKPWGWVVSTGNYVDDMQKQMNSTKQEINTFSSDLMRNTLIVCIILLVIISILGGFFGTYLGTPLKRLADAAKEISKGKISIDLQKTSGKSEISVLQNSFCDLLETFQQQAEIIHTLSNGNFSISVQAKSEEDIVGNALATLINENHSTFTQMSIAADQIEQGSVQIAEASKNLADGATEQASAIEEITASVTDIANKSKSNASEVGDVQNMIVEAAQAIRSGNDQMQEMVTAMKEIKSASEDIQKIIKVIDDIAFNTNILALNASVEASRAGEHGKGFVVVAEEVRNLAGRSAEASKQTADMIEDSIHRVQKGFDLAIDTKEALQTISNLVERITESGSIIAQASTEQAASASQIDEALAQISQITQTNSATSEQCAAASEELSNQTRLLHMQISKFQL